MMPLSSSSGACGLYTMDHMHVMSLGHVVNVFRSTLKVIMTARAHGRGRDGGAAARVATRLIDAILTFNHGFDDGYTRMRGFTDTVINLQGMTASQIDAAFHQLIAAVATCSPLIPDRALREAILRALQAVQRVDERLREPVWDVPLTPSGGPDYGRLRNEFNTAVTW
jgi:hypothetical protein